MDLDLYSQNNLPKFGKFALLILIGYITMIKLFYAPGTCALAVHIVLEWIGEQYELQLVKLGDPEYLKINPLGQVPAIIDSDREVMNQADAILKYLAQKYPVNRLVAL